MYTEKTIVKCESGLHNKQAICFIQKANEFRSSIWVEVEDRKINAQKFESAFYGNPDLRSVRAPEETKPQTPPAQTPDLASLIVQLQQSPELVALLSQLVSARANGLR